MYYVCTYVCMYCTYILYIPTCSMDSVSSLARPLATPIATRAVRRLPVWPACLPAERCRRDGGARTCARRLRLLACRLPGCAMRTPPGQWLGPGPHVRTFRHLPLPACLPSSVRTVLSVSPVGADGALRTHMSRMYPGAAPLRGAGSRGAVPEPVQIRR